jgi:TonB family protein
MPDHPVPEPKTSSLQGSSPGGESDLGELAALFAAHGGDGLSAEVSAELALEVVLNEIVEQACLATGATGAAIVLVRDGEMVCRASNGANAPELGAPLGSESGLTAECIKTRQVQRCGDAQSDPRADAEASRSLGVRSVMILPLLRKGEMAGVLEVFSPLPGAFGDRDEVTLEALAHRILQNLERASEPLSLSSSAAKSELPQNPVAAVSLPAPEVEELRTGLAMRLSGEDAVPVKIAGRSERAGFDVVSLALGTAVLGCAVLLGALVGIRLGWRRAAGARGQAVKPASGAVHTAQSALQSAARNSVVESGATQIDVEPGTGSLSGAGSSGAGSAAAVGNEKKNASVAVSKRAGAKDSFPPAGSLLVYENGKEVFRMPPTVEGEAAESAGSEKVKQASAQEPAGVVELAPEAAEGSLLHRVEPEYPEEARQQRIQGAVVLEVRIGRDGAVQDVNLVSGQPLLADAAIAAVKQWRFKPRMLKGQAVEMQTRVTLNFRMPS